MVEGRVCAAKVIYLYRGRVCLDGPLLASVRLVASGSGTLSTALPPVVPETCISIIKYLIFFPGRKL